MAQALERLAIDETDPARRRLLRTHAMRLRRRLWELQERPRPPATRCPHGLRESSDLLGGQRPQLWTVEQLVGHLSERVKMSVSECLA